MTPAEILSIRDPKSVLREIISSISKDGPVDQELLETLAYLKEYFPDTFAEEEPKLMYVLGLFYKVEEPQDLISFVFSVFKESIENEYGQTLTPIQASIRKKIDANKYFSFSAPTSAGKSHLLRELVLGYNCDIVIVLPSRALISEYLITVRNIVQGRKDILVLQFIDDVNRARVAKRVFIVTPERCADLFRLSGRFNIGMFIFDEAQISEESIRGVTFDALVRRSDKVFKDAKKIFVHPFVENPGAQLIKHGFEGECSESHVYRQNAVGKIYIERDSLTGSYSYFSPFLPDGYKKKNKFEVDFDPVKEVLLAGGSVLIFVSKKFIYDG
ncbi:DEAD/DEAH box helicase, partial [Stutzerimonas stutzeri]|uniref:DEAD/DEAH box helicase n=1 Tax=Stutzerimonas stutzeri TaxID=316 RepID=UPI00210EDFD4